MPAYPTPGISRAGGSPSNGGVQMMRNPNQKAMSPRQHPAAAGGQQQLPPNFESRADFDAAVNRYAQMAAAQQRDGPPGSNKQQTLTKAQSYAIASRLARAPGANRSNPNSRQMNRPPPQQRGQQQPMPMRRKQRVITPEMIARRPIEQKHNIMMRSQHGKKKGSNDSVSGSVNTEATEQVQNTTARRMKDGFTPTLERVDTLESMGESKENAGAVHNAKAAAPQRKPPRGKSRVITPQMIARRPIEQKQNVMMRSSHGMQQGNKGKGNMSSSDSVNTEATEQVQNTKAALSAQRKRGNSRGGYMPTLETVDTLESMPTFESKESKENAGAVHNTGNTSVAGSVMSGASNGSNGKKGFLQALKPSSSKLSASSAPVVPASSSKKMPPGTTDRSVLSEQKTGKPPTQPPSSGGFRSFFSKSSKKKDQGDDNSSKNSSNDSRSSNNNAKKFESIAKAAKDANASNNAKKIEVAPVSPAHAKPAYGKKSSLITVAEYALSNSSAGANNNGNVRTNLAAKPAANSGAGAPLSTQSEDLESKDSLLTEGEITLMHTLSSPMNKRNVTGGHFFNEDEGKPAMLSSPRISANNTGKPNERDVVKHVKTPSGTELLTIDTDVMSHAVPSSLLSPVNKEDMEVQLPSPSPAAAAEVPSPKPAAAEVPSPGPAAAPSAPVVPPAVASPMKAPEPVQQKAPEQAPPRAALPTLAQETSPPENKASEAATSAVATPASTAAKKVMGLLPWGNKKQEEATTAAASVASNDSRMASSTATPVVAKKKTIPEPQKKVEPAPKKTSAVDAKLEQSNSRVGQLKKELLQLARPGMDSSASTSSVSAAQEKSKVKAKEAEVEETSTSKVSSDGNSTEEAETGVHGGEEGSNSGRNSAVSSLSSKSSMPPNSSTSAPALKPIVTTITTGKNKMAPGVVPPPSPAATDRAVTSAPKSKKNKNRRAGPSKMKSFLGRKSKVIEEEKEYVAEEEEEDGNEEKEVKGGHFEEREDFEEMYEDEDAEELYEQEQAVEEPKYQRPSTNKRKGGRPPPPRQRHHGATYEGRKPPPSGPPKKYVQEDETSASDLSLAMKSTLSDAEFISVQSSVTTDQEAFAYKPGMLKRTASLVKNPALALRHRSRSKEKLDEEELMKRLKNARIHARADNRKREEFDEDGNPIEDKRGRVVHQEEKESQVTDPKLEEFKHVHHISAHDDAIHETLHTAGTREDMDMPYNDDEQYEEYLDDEEIEAMYEDDDNDILMVTTTETFDDTLTMKERRALAMQEQQKQMQMQQQQVRFQMGPGVDGGTQMHTGPDNIATYPVVRTVSSGLGRIGQVPSKEIATQTSTSPSQSVNEIVDSAVQQTSSFAAVPQTASFAAKAAVSPNISRENSTSAAEGSFAHVMESVGLFAAQCCSTASNVMYTCADSCSDNPHSQHKQMATHRHSSADNSMVPPSSPSTPTVSAHGCGIASAPGASSASKKDTESEATDLFTRALAMALRTTMGATVDEPKLIMSKPHVQSQHMSSSPHHQHVAHKHMNVDMYTDFESVDGRFISLQQQKQMQRRKKHVPRNIAVKPKKPLATTQEESNVEQATKEAAEEAGPSDPPELKRTNSLKRVPSAGKTAKKGGFGKFFKKIPRVRLGVMYEV